MSTIMIPLGASIQAAINANPAGTTFQLADGTYYGEQFEPQSNDQFIGASDGGTVLSGATLLNNWTQSAGYWTDSNLPTQTTGTVIAGSNPLSSDLNDLFIDNVLYTRVATLSAVTAGSWYYDPSNGTAYISDNPTGKTVEMSTTPYMTADEGATGVVIQNLTIEKYATNVQIGPIQGGVDWQLNNVTSTENHGAGLVIGAGTIVQGGNYSGNGQVGIDGGGANGAKVLNATVENNNYAGYDPNFDDGGIKLAVSSNVTISGDTVSNNNGNGIWGDIDSSNWTVTNNTIANNAGNGIMYEISHASTTISNNTITDNTGAGIFISNSDGVTASNNTITVGPNNPIGADGGIDVVSIARGSSPETGTLYQSVNDTVQNNIIIQTSISAQNGIWVGQALPANPNDVFNSNTYYTPNGTGTFWNFGSTGYTWSALQQAGSFESTGIDHITLPASTALAASPAPVTTSSGPDVLTLKVSEDSYANGDGSDAAGDAEFKVSVDGQQQGGTFIATAAHATGAEQLFNFDGYFGAGSHTVTITFLNDAYNPAAPDANGSIDRNLYVDDVIYNGTNTGQSDALLTNGSEAFSVTGGTPPPKPTISGTAAGRTTTDETTMKPFSAVAITDANSSQSETVTVTLSSTANGSLSNLGIGSYNAGTGVYTVSGTAAAVTGALDAVVFTPTAHQVAPGTSVTTGFTINDTDTAGATASDSTTTAVATAVNDPPVINGTAAGQAATDKTTVKPFSAVAINDVDFGQSETVTVTLSATANGSLSNLGTGSYNASKGVYTVTGTNGAVTSALEALVFTPTPQQVAPGGTVTTGFTITATDTAGATTSNGTTAVVATATTPPVIGPTIITLNISEDAWKGDAQFNVKVDGVQVGGVDTASVLHSSGDSGVFVLSGTWATGAHQVQIQFINDAYGGTPATDRNLYVNSIAVNGVTYSGTAATMLGDSTDAFTVGGTTPVTSAPADKLTLNLSEDAWNGNAQFSLSIDGKQVSTPQDVTALHSTGAWEAISFEGNFGAGSHTIGITFTNDAYGGTSTTDRNLYVNGIDLNGTHYGNGVTALYTNGAASFALTTTH